MTDLRQLILDRATAWTEQELTDGEEPIWWSPGDLADAISEFNWNDGIPLTCDIPEIAATLNGRFKDRRPVKPEPTETKKKRHYKRAIRVSRSPEIWRHLEHYPGYQISSHGRLRSAQRANDTDVLKPRFSWHYGKLVAAYNILDKDGIKRSRFVGTLMINAGFVKARDWKKEKSEVAV